MYETFVGLNNRPFAAVPVVEGYFPGTVCENARIALTRCIERGEGIGMVVGPVGTGKTLLCQKIGELFKNTYRVVFLSSGRLGSRRSLFQAILYELGQPYRSMDEGELRLALVDYLQGSKGDGSMFSDMADSTTQVFSPKNGPVPDNLTSGRDQSRGLLLMVDEAHTLPLRLLDEIRMLTNLARGGQPLVRVILAGNSALEERLANPKLDSFNSRIATRCYLEAFNRTETAEYLRAKIELTGGNGTEVFSDDACQSVYRATEGVPRLINQLCDYALLAAFAEGRRRLEAEHIEEAWADLQQLPAPWNGESQGEKPGVIEFGRLDDLTEEEDEAESIKLPTPPLKINAEMDGLDLDLSEPVEPAAQIDSISQMIAGAAETFEPSYPIEPGIEPSFDEFEHPFQEPFEQEEIVSDRYATPTAALSVLQSVIPVFQFGTMDELPVVQGTIAEHQVEGSAEAPATVSRQTSSAFAARTNNEEAMREPEKQPASLVEEEQPVVETAAVHPVVPVRPVRRNAYSRLFLKLRQG
ncbi:MAG: AAA family ATPase [Pirellulales bacterium]|nr:AAA family ATPase [Pirellulales bacterium]